MSFNVFNMKVSVSVGFAAVLTVMTLIDREGSALWVMLAVLIHESGHLFMMRKFGCLPKEIHLVPASVKIIGGYCSSLKERALISVLGPVFNILSAMVFGICYILISPIFLRPLIINLSLAVFNLLPFKGLDGGDAAEYLFSKWIGQSKAETVVKVYTIIISFCMVVLAVSVVFVYRVNPSILIVSVYLLVMAIMKN